jgi:hypothetical protein
MLALADPEEVARLRLTPTRLRAMLQDAAGVPGGLMLGPVIPEALNPMQSRYNRWASVEIRSSGGAPLAGRRLGATLQAYTTDRGWKIGISNFLYAVHTQRRGMEGRKARHAGLCLRHGVKPELFWPDDGSWEALPPVRGTTPPAER